MCATTLGALHRNWKNGSTPFNIHINEYFVAVDATEGNFASNHGIFSIVLVYRLSFEIVVGDVNPQQQTTGSNYLPLTLQIAQNAPKATSPIMATGLPSLRISLRSSKSKKSLMDNRFRWNIGRTFQDKRNASFVPSFEASVPIDDSFHIHLFLMLQNYDLSCNRELFSLVLLVPWPENYRIVSSLLQP